MKRIEFPHPSSAVTSRTSYFANKAEGAIKIVPGPMNDQNVVMVSPKSLSANHLVPLDGLPHFQRFMACYRYTSCWMQAAYGSKKTDLPTETQFVLLELEDGYLALHLLVDGEVRCSLEQDAGRWLIRLETGNPGIPCPETRAALMTWGKHPHEVAQRAAEGIRKLLGTVRLREDKHFPKSAKNLGWCSWNAFYEDLSTGKILALFERLDACGVLPKLVIIDGGWQQINDRKMVGFDTDPAKFPEGLKSLITHLKEIGVEDVYVWQTYNGYWQGTSASVLGENNTEIRFFSVPDHLADRIHDEVDKRRDDTMFKSFYPPNLLGQPIEFPKGSLFSLYDSMHSRLSSAGVSGVKIDAMTWIEALHGEESGRVAAVRDMVHSAEASSALHFDGGLIHCSSCSNDFIYSSLNGAIVRTSGDFMPEDPSSHGRHVVTNAMVAFWTAPFVVPDWDMFQSGHEAGLYHAAARAISGGPVYLTDDPDRINPEIIARLRLSDGSLPLCLEPALPTVDALFSDPIYNCELLKIFNRNSANMVLGAFHCGGDPKDATTRSSHFVLRDLPWHNGGKAAVWSEKSQSLSLMRDEDSLTIELGFLGFDILTIAPVLDGLALVGNVNLLNPGGAISDLHREIDGECLVCLHDGGRFTGWSQTCPTIFAGDAKIDAQWNKQSGKFQIELETGRPWEIRILTNSETIGVHSENRTINRHICNTVSEIVG